ncbi:replication-relaxation family protein [Niallia taxi]|uniref:replication-relaxation family protein n=1 Tax=Niallia taxi TaxID=2499688 RepID=UPI0015F591B0|nr:replication-relaxation family protein [Niallia taxi]
MITIGPEKFKDIEVKFIKLLYEFRALTVEQIGRLFYPFENRPLTKLSYQYRCLSNLTKRGFVVSTLLPNDSKTKLYYLTPTGIDKAKGFLEIYPGQAGDGFYTQGDFDYNLIQPPQKNIYHHMLATDSFVSVEEFNSLIPTMPIQWRDNRYASEVWESEDKEKRFRPDGELLIHGNRVVLEADRATEKVSALTEKFEGYYRYFKYLEETNQSERIPKAVVFILETPTNSFHHHIRWNTVTDKWNKSIGEYEKKVRLFTTSKDEFSSFLRDYDYFTQSRNREVIAKAVFEQRAVHYTDKIDFFNTGDIKACPYDTIVGVEYITNTMFWLAERPGLEPFARFENMLEWVKTYSAANPTLSISRFVPIFISISGVPNTKEFPFAFVLETDQEQSSLIWHLFQNGKEIPISNTGPWHRWDELNIPNNVYSE